MEKQQMEFMKKKGFSEPMPDKVGLWQLACSENDYKPDYVAITKRGEFLIVHDEDYGTCELKVYHDNLIYPMWKYII